MEPVLALPGLHALWEPLTPVWLESSLWEIEPYLVTDLRKRGNADVPPVWNRFSWRTWTRMNQNSQERGSASLESLIVVISFIVHATSLGFLTPFLSGCRFFKALILSFFVWHSLSDRRKQRDIWSSNCISITESHSQVHCAL